MLTSLSKDWEENVSKEVMNFVQAVQHNFRHGLMQSLEYTPDKTAPNNRARVLDYFIDGLCGVTVQCIAKYANASESLEDMVKQKLGEKFEYIRKSLPAELQAQLRDRHPTSTLSEDKPAN